MAGNYLDNKNPIDLLCKSIVDMMRRKALVEIREIFHIKNDFTLEKEKEIHEENAWPLTSDLHIVSSMTLILLFVVV
ncbi:hypothetical protein MANES_16G058950v8 [Manihot esculenta]|uniref:Uncharacterized protein n=2 Tax=Manihot esculenta TaxID=3983 RepID=A0ACB7G630_MANES|nr:hypothetical protein MANES_16G058950v8 [Manihot esculenta]KAG8635735.1 hypothetical protein MANES_16G058950v8 [Manihot esculenta]